MTITDTFNVPDIPAVIAKWPADGLGLVQARQRMPSYGRKIPVGLAIQARGSQVAFEYAKRTMFQACEGDLRRMLGSRMLVLVCFKSEQPDQPIVVAAEMISHLQFNFDLNIVQFRDGTILEGCCIHSAAHWLAKPKEPLLIRYDGPPPPLIALIHRSEDEDGALAGKVGAPESYEVEKIRKAAEDLAKEYSEGKGLPDTATLFREKVADKLQGHTLIPGDTQFKEICNPIYNAHKAKHKNS